MFIKAIPGGRVVWIVGLSQHVTFLTMELFYKHPFPSYILPWGPLNHLCAQGVDSTPLLVKISLVFG